MPLIDASYISTWYTVTESHLDPGSGSPVTTLRLLEHYDTAQQQEVEKKKVLQGDTGMRVASVGGNWWKTTVESHVLMIEYNNGNNQQITSIFDLIGLYFAALRDPTQLQYLPALMESADINIQPDAISCTLNLLSDGIGGGFVPYYGPPVTPYTDYIGRPAKWYDTLFYVSASLGNNLQIRDGHIKINVEISKNYFQGAGATPFFSIQGYTVEGDMNVLMTPNMFGSTSLAPQPLGSVNATGVCQTALTIVNGPTLAFGESSFNTEYSQSIKGAELTSCKFGFKTFARYSP